MLEARILSAERRPEAFWAEVDVPQVPTLEEFAASFRPALNKPYPDSASKWGPC